MWIIFFIGLGIVVTVAIGITVVAVLHDSAASPKTAPRDRPRATG